MRFERRRLCALRSFLDTGPRKVCRFCVVKFRLEGKAQSVGFRVSRLFAFRVQDCRVSENQDSHAKKRKCS